MTSCVYSGMEGKRCLITGGSSGVGKAFALGLAKMGAWVVILCRDRSRGERVIEEIRSRSGNRNVELMCADLSVQRSIRIFAQEFKERYGKLHVLGNIAGVILPGRLITAERIEKTLATDYLSHFLLTHLLLDVLKASAPSRIITVSGGRWVLEKARIHFDDLELSKRYNWMEAAKQAVLARFIFSCELAKRLNGTGVTSNTFHPGRVRSNLPRHFPWYIRLVYGMVSPFLKEECETCLLLACAKELEGINGKYFVDAQPEEFTPEGYTEGVAHKLWSISEQMTGIREKAENFLSGSQ